MDITPFQKLIKPDKYQVFLFTCPAIFPFNFARHPWFVINKKGELSRWEMYWRKNASDTSWGYLCKNLYPLFQGLEKFPFSKKYFSKDVRLVGLIEGEKNSLAHHMTKYIETSPQTYIHRDAYSLSGNNSNTYGHWVLNHFPESKMYLPWNAFGRKYRIPSESASTQQF